MLLAIATILLQFSKPYTVVPTISPAPILNSRGHQVALDGDVLTFWARRPGEKLWLQGGVSEPMQRVGKGDLWTLSLKMRGWSKAFMGFGFSDEEFVIRPVGSWRGPDAPRSPIRAHSLRGKIAEVNVKSAALGETRKLFIYQPAGPHQKPLPALYITDGADCRRFAEILEPLIQTHKIRPIAIVGVENGGYRGKLLDTTYDLQKDFRSQEYVAGVNPDRFARHLRFFVDEVPSFVSRNFSISYDPRLRAILGYSNGGHFAASVAFLRPTAFGTAIPLSIGSPFETPVPARLPRFIQAAGTLEPCGTWASQLDRRIGHGRSSLDLYVAGHDPELWDLAFATILPRVFPPDLLHSN